MRRSLAALAALVLLGAGAGVARADHRALDPERGGRAVVEARHDERYAFCREPSAPLPERARGLCELSADIPDCEGLREACAALAPKEPDRWLLRFAPALLALAKVLLWALVGLIGALLAVPLVRLAVQLWRRQRRAPADAPEEVAPATPSGHDADDRAIAATAPGDPALWIARGDGYARDGKLALAVSAYLGAALRALDARGAVHLEPHRTNGEYVRSCRDGAARPVLSDLARTVDHAEFGHAPLTQADAERARGLARQIVSSALVALSAVLACACSDAGLPAPTVRDPAGHELVLDVLARSGFDARPLGQSIASLDPPEEPEAAPVLVIDLDRTALDDDARERLFAWVRRGGVLLAAGGVASLPDDLAVDPSFGTTRDVAVRPLFLPRLSSDDDADTSDATSRYGVPPAGLSGAKTAGHEAIGSEKSPLVAWRSDRSGYAAEVPLAKGSVLVLASSDWLTNAGIARPDNATALVALVDHVATRPDGSARPLRVAEARDGVSPPRSPLASLVRAGLGWGIAHAAIFVLVLFLAYGTRHARPRLDRPPARRDFAEHVRATAALYAYARAAGHAASALARLLERKAPAWGSRAADPATVLAAAASSDRSRVLELLDDAAAPQAPRARLAHELARLRALRALYLRADASQRHPTRSR